MSAKFLDDEARATFERAIKTIESVSAAKLVVAVRRRSHEYRNANLLVGTPSRSSGSRRCCSRSICSA